jgi:RNA polymerase sigma-70 factor (ECF subfamily)
MCDEGSSASLEAATEVFLGVRNRLFGIAYRILNSRTDAEDIVQEAWLRWQMCDRNAVVDPRAFLATTTARLCINTMQTAHARHETHVGSWLPEPTDASADPLLAAERCEELEFATIMLIEKLSPRERAAYVLREAFDYPYGQIAVIVAVTEQNARQLVSRARKRLAVQSEGREAAGSAERQRLFAAFVAAAQGDLVPLEMVFADDAIAAPAPIAA